MSGADAKHEEAKPSTEEEDKLKKFRPDIDEDAMKEADEILKKPIDLSFATDIPEDDEGYKPITWTQLQKVFSLERPATKFRLHGDISQKLTEHWARSKQIKVRDVDGKEMPLFFYCEDTEPHFTYDDVQVGNHIVINEPRLHFFMDGQIGMRVEKPASIAKVEKQKFTDVQRMDYGRLNKNHGNAAYAKQKYDDAIDFYSTAIGHVSGSFKEHPEFEAEGKEINASCHLNVAACHVASKAWAKVEEPCNKALQVNASEKLNAKAYFRLGQSYLAQHKHTHAREALLHALELAPGDSRVTAEYDKLCEEVKSERDAQREIVKRAQGRTTSSEFGLKRQIFSKTDAKLETVENFRDVGGTPLSNGNKVKKFVLYRSSRLSHMSMADMNKLCDELGVKTVLDLRASIEIKTDKKKHGNATLHGIRERFTSVVRFKNNKFVVPSVRGLSEQEVLAGRVLYEVSLAESVIAVLATFWIKFVAVLLYCLFMRSRSRRYLLNNTVGSEPVATFYKQLVDLSQSEMKAAFDVLCDPSHYPIIFHCSQGKDRTGVLCALILSVLGADEETIVNDYVRSNEVDLETLTQRILALGLPKEWAVCEPHMMRETLQHVKTKYGGAVEYLLSIGVTSEQLDSLRATLTHSAPSSST